MAIYGPDALLATAIALPTLGIVAVCLRFYVRLRLRRTYIGVDDWLILASVLLVCGHGVIQVLGVVLGVGGQDDVPEETRDKTDIAYQQKLSHAIVEIEKVTYATAKLSVLFLYRRVFGASPSFRRAVDALVALTVLWTLVFIFVESFVCIADSSTSTTCAEQQWALLWFAITEVLGDIIILSLPYPRLRKLQMSRRDKIGLGAIFALGTLSTVMGVVRLGYVCKSFYAFFHPDFVNDTGSAPGFWTTVEVSVGVLAACLPPLGPLLRMASGPKKLYYSIRHNLLSRSRSKRTFAGTEKTADSDVTAVEGGSNSRPVREQKKGTRTPNLPLHLPANNHLSQVPALGLTSSDNLSPVTSMSTSSGAPLSPRIAESDGPLAVKPFDSNV